MRRLIMFLVAFLVVSLATCWVAIAAGITEKYWESGGWSTLAEFEGETGRTISVFSEAPMLSARVANGELPVVEKRLPLQPFVVDVVEEIGQYGGEWRQAWLGVDQIWPWERDTMEGIVQFSWDGTKVVPNLAETWEISEDATTYTFHLKQGVKWSDGAPFTAEDIVFALTDVFGNEELYPDYPKWLRAGEEPPKCQALDDYTVRIEFSNPYGTFLMKLADTSSWSGGLDGFPKHYLKQFLPKYAGRAEVDTLAKQSGMATWAQLWTLKTHRTMNPDLPTLRPWVVVTEPGEIRTIFERNPYYWKVDPNGNQLPYIDRMVYEEVGDPEMISMKAIMGEIDCQTWSLGSHTHKYTLFMENRDKGDYRVLHWTHADGSKQLIMPNYSYTEDEYIRELIHNDQFRKALSLAIDREEINELVYAGLGEPMQAAFVPGVPYYDEEWTTLYVDYDPDTANALLDEIGLEVKNKEGWRLRPDGEPLSIVLEAEAADVNVKPLELVVDYWRQVGIRASLKTHERRLYEERGRANEVQILTWGNFDRQFPNFLLEPLRVVPFAVSTADCPWNEYARWYVSGGKLGIEPKGVFRELQVLYDKAISTSDEAERDHYAKEIVRLHKENLFLIGTVARVPFMCLVRNDFRNVPENFISDWMPRWIHSEQFFIRQ
ncbi:MAG: ABC transporter substrate-binding protein [Limnochordia bacterium]|jgi:peptide/nickel transport system substrate-binding protein